MAAIPSQLTSLDFFEIKESIKSYLRTRNEFTDYDFEGSAASYLIDTLAYNTYYTCLLYTSPSPRDGLLSRMPSSA